LSNCNSELRIISPGISTILEVLWNQTFSSCGSILQLTPISILFGKPEHPLIFSVRNVFQHQENFGGFSINLICTLKRWLKNPARELGAIAHYKSPKYNTQSKPTCYSSSPLLFCCARISPSLFNTALKVTANCRSAQKIILPIAICQDIDTSLYMKNLLSVFRHTISYLSTVKHILLKMVQLA